MSSQNTQFNVAHRTIVQDNKYRHIPHHFKIKLSIHQLKQKMRMLYQFKRALKLLCSQLLNSRRTINICLNHRNIEYWKSIAFIFSTLIIWIQIFRKLIYDLINLAPSKSLRTIQAVEITLPLHIYHPLSGIESISF